MTAGSQRSPWPAATPPRITIVSLGTTGIIESR
jgi:hypothetical protein